MKFRPGIRRSLLTALLAAVVCIAAAEAAVPQTPPQGVKGGSVSLERFRGKKSIVRGGRMPLPDSLRRDSLGRDSLRTAVDSTLLRLDSLGGALLPQDSLLLQLTGRRLAAARHAAARFAATRFAGARTGRHRPHRKETQLVHERLDVAVARLLDVDPHPRLRPDLQQAILETPDPLRHVRHLAGAVLSREQEVQAAQTPLRGDHEPGDVAHGGAGRRAERNDPPQHAPANLPVRSHRLLHLFHRRRGGQLRHQRRIVGQESHDAGHDLPRRPARSTTRVTGRFPSCWADSPR